jgi:cell division septation protein DedD
MAGQDFARVEVPKKPESDGGAGSLLAVLGIAFVAVICFAAGFWLGGNRNAKHEVAHPELDVAQAQLREKAARIELQQARIEALEESIEEWRKKADQGASAKVGELRFYHDLPMQSVTPAPVSDLPTSKASVRPALPPHPAKPSIKKQASSKSVSMRATDKAAKQAITDKPAAAGISKTVHVYQVQVASFKTTAEAVRFQKKLFNAGFSAFIRNVDLAEKGKWSRVYAGPYSSRDAAEKARTGIYKLTKIKGLLVRGR